MKSLLRSEAALLIIVAGLAFACKNETAPADNLQLLHDDNKNGENRKPVIISL